MWGHKGEPGRHWCLTGLSETLPQRRKRNEWSQILGDTGRLRSSPGEGGGDQVIYMKRRTQIQKWFVQVHWQIHPDILWWTTRSCIQRDEVKRKRKTGFTSSLEKLIFFPCRVLLKKSVNYIFGFTSIDMIFAHVYHQSIPHTFNNAWHTKLVRVNV